ncbi:hypothetical protein [Pelagicoccus mobilis]|uniref:Uncharacterized protein n=1 Tax=Pelagicoccus mobilis TaxID=415221 RepID=A0A934VQ62_9BACT|nr:hypothetical protein [Pelagicoccus mobilis]MBK1876560.1 hypothetical protein [Pelagicoccus mobilis]
MLKDRVVERTCNLVHREVKLELACDENETTGFQTPSMIKACDSCHLCGVKNGTEYHWERCLFYGKAL